MRGSNADMFNVFACAARRHELGTAWQPRLCLPLHASISPRTFSQPTCDDGRWQKAQKHTHTHTHTHHFCALLSPTRSRKAQPSANTQVRLTRQTLALHRRVHHRAQSRAKNRPLSETKDAAYGCCALHCTLTRAQAGVPFAQHAAQQCTCTGAPALAHISALPEHAPQRAAHDCACRASAGAHMAASSAHAAASQFNASVL